MLRAARKMIIVPSVRFTLVRCISRVDLEGSGPGGIRPAWDQGTMR